MNKLGICVVAIIIMMIVGYGFYDNVRKLKPVTDTSQKIKEHDMAVDKYTRKLEEILDNEADSKIKNSSGSVSNFEGPKLSIAYISHHGKVWDKESPPNFTINSSYATLDPDHQDYGLPDFRVELSQPIFVSSIESGVLKKDVDAVRKIFSGISEVRPIKSYTKTYLNRNGEYKKDKFDLYLTEFEVTIGVKPLRANPLIRITSADKKTRIFPREWYQDNVLNTTSKLISLDDMKNIEEYKNQRYSRIFVVFKMEPNPGAWYIDSTDGRQINASVAIGSIVTKNISSNIKLKDEYREAHIDPGSPGLSVDMFDGDPSLGGKVNVSTVLQTKPERIEESIFNKDMYFRITSNNIGSWDNKIVFWGSEWDDQYTIKFFMPILIKGKLDVVLDPKLIPKYVPPEAYFDKFSIADLIPTWGLNQLGKLISYTLIIFCLIVAIFFLPNLFVLFNSVLGWLSRLVRFGNQQP